MPPPESSARLVFSESGKPETTIVLGDALTIGRSPGNDLVLEDQAASRRHAEIRHDGRGRYTILDAGSANGTWVNGRRLTSPRDLIDGDAILIGTVALRFSAPAAAPGQENAAAPGAESGTDLRLKNEMVVILVADIRNYTRMSEALPNMEFSLLIANWFKESTDVIERCGGTIDKFIGDTVMAYWLVGERQRPAREVNDALLAARNLIARAASFAARLAAQFPEHTFRIGIGINAGDALLGNVGDGGHQSFTIVGDSVNVAFRLESLTKDKGCDVVVSRKITEHAAAEFVFADLGQAEVKGRAEPVSIWALRI